MKDHPSWSNIHKTLQNLDSKLLIAVIEDLHNLSPENRDFLAARFAASPGNQPAREAYRQRIHEIFFPRRGFPEKLDLRAGRKAFNEYKKATGDFEGTIDLMLAYVESGTEFTNRYGDIDMPFYDSLMSVLEKTLKLLQKSEEGAEVYALHRQRFLALRREAGFMGWGYGDCVTDTVSELEAYFDVIYL